MATVESSQKSNGMCSGCSDIFSRCFCSTVAETIGVINYAASFGVKNVQKTTFEAAEMMLGPWNQQLAILSCQCSDSWAALEWLTYSIESPGRLTSCLSALEWPTRPPAFAV